MSNPLDENIKKLAIETLEKWHVPGLSIAVVDGETTWAEGYGISNFPSTPATPSTLYSVGSTTKAFTAAAISLLVDSGAVKWTTPICSIIPDDFVLHDETATREITIEDALSHRTGMSRHDLSYGGIGAHTAREVTRNMRYLPLSVGLREKFIYCNMMYMVLTHVLETLSSRPISEVFQEKILDPLEMSNTHFSIPTAREKGDLAQGYSYSFETKKYGKVPDLDVTESMGAGMLVSNVLDFAKWIQCMISHSPPLSRAGHEEIRKPRIVEGRSEEEMWPFEGELEYALGWDTGVYRGERFFMHGGGMEAFSANVVWFPDVRFGVVGLGNTAITAKFVEDVMIWRLVDDKLGVPMGERFDWNSRNEQLLAEWERKYNNAMSIHYPSIPNPPVPLPFPISEYKGTYTHPAYRNMTVILDVQTKRLKILRTEAQWRVKIEFEHVSGESFLAWMQSIGNPSMIPGLRDAFLAKFKIGREGIPVAFGLMLDADTKDGQMVWFQRD